MRRVFICAILILIVSAGKTGIAQDNVVARVAGKDITIEEFDKQYLKTLADYSKISSITLQEKKEYLDLYIKYKLKVYDARERGVTEYPDLKKEMLDFRKNYLVSYFVDKKIVEPYLKKLEEMRQFEVRVFQIYIKLPPVLTLEDSVTLYNRAYSLIDSLKDGKDISYLAARYSDDPYAYSNGGDLYYFTAGMTGLPDFEEYVYGMEPGTFSTAPYRSPFGLHVLLLADKKGKPPTIKLAHIFARDKIDTLYSFPDTVSSLKKILSLLDSLKSGLPFEYLAQQYSEDPGSSINKGIIGYIERRKIGPPWGIDSTAFTMKVGETAGPLRTPNGWHIIKVLDIKEKEKESEDEMEMKSEYKKGPAFKNDYKKFLGKMKKQYDLNFDIEGIKKLSSMLDTSKPLIKQKSDSLFKESDRQIRLASYKVTEPGSETEIFTIEDFFVYVPNARDFNTLKPTEENLMLMTDDAVSVPILFNAAVYESYDFKDDFIATFEEFVDGLLIFKIQEELSSMSIINDKEIKEYYEKNKSGFIIKDSNGTRQKSLSESKSEIANILQPIKYQETEQKFIIDLMTKYKVEIFENVLDMTLRNIKIPEQTEEIN